jgi:chromosome partitioning protein
MRAFDPSRLAGLVLAGAASLLAACAHVQDAVAPNPALTVQGLVLTMFDGRTNLAQQVVNEIRKNAPAFVFDTLIPRNVRLSEAPSFGEAILTYAPRSPGAMAYEALTQELLKQETSPRGRHMP